MTIQDHPSRDANAPPDGIFQKYRALLSAQIWESELHSLPGARRFLLRTARFLYVLIRDLLQGDLNLRAMSLVYSTLLSLVPLLAVSFSVLKAFGAHNQLEPVLYNFMEPLGTKGKEVADNIVGFVENIRVGVLGSVGVGLLIYTVISLLQKIESAFNFVWHINSLRSIGQRFSNYLSVILVGPVLVFTALGLTATLMNTNLVQRLQAMAPLGRLMEFATQLTPYVLVWIAFTFIYVFVPNTRVRAGSAAVGALVAAFAWQTSGWGFTAFVASSARFPAVYSSFAILILLLIWLYLNWFILLLGAQIAFYYQNPRYITIKPVHLVLSNRLKERLALGVMFLIGSHHYHSRKPWTLDSLVAHLDLPPDPVNRLLMLLRGSGFVERTASEPPAYLPARAIESIGVNELLAAVRQAGETDLLQLDPVASPDPVDGVLDKVRAAVADELGELSLRDLVLQEGESMAQVHPLDGPAPGRIPS